MLALNEGARIGDFAHDTGEGGISRVSAADRWSGISARVISAAATPTAPFPRKPSSRTPVRRR
ncbi:membrane protein [Bordetella pertussis]|nr:membrane protein [Bordetella pertussis]